MSMYFDSWSGFLVMEGHGLYVWSAYTMALAVIAYNLIAPFMARRRILAQLAAQVRRQERLVQRKVIVNEVTTSRGDNNENRSANPENTQLKHRPGRQEEGSESVERSAQ
ncbi:heme exporter protein CcmD [Endozoicomonas acroporae]|uniref:heme exporter protein CcmD n=1 Tax=Endozoicomonas acroporae TaxID=1701104 RepID=UPI001F505AA7|nr:heme exporter protein CcmD [Endozoicomonas acroporae]